MAQSPKKHVISVVIPVYNVEKWLDRCLGSVLSQTRLADEIVLVDDGSTDSSGALCDLYAGKYDSITVVHQQNGGLSAARNCGIRASSGDLISFIDSDDWVAPEFLEKLEGALDAAAADIACCGFLRVSSEKEFGLKRKSGSACIEYTADEYMLEFLRVGTNRCVHYAWNKLYKRSVLVDAQYPEGMLNEDVEGFFKALIEASKVVEVGADLYAYFVNADSITGGKFGQNFLSLGEVWSRVLDIASERRPDLTPLIQYNLDRVDFTILCDMIVHGDRCADRVFSDQRFYHQRKLRQNLRVLLRGPMVRNRKIAAFAIAYAYDPILNAYRLFQRLSRIFER